MNMISEELDNQCIETRRVWNPMHKQPMFKSFDYFTGKNVSDALFSKSLCLPYCLNLEKSVAEKIIKWSDQK
jgi:dTDP-4-amino-4,6-dideoxygalactose transaminase